MEHRKYFICNIVCLHMFMFHMHTSQLLYANIVANTCIDINYNVYTKLYHM